jgi:hypothetical protein
VNPKDDEIRPKWRFQLSLFKPYKYDTEKQFDKCFEFDWKCTKMPRLVKDVEDRVKLKEIVRKYYKYIKFGYKWFSA